jgi:glycosyltransferase involved in cell wall biosynthesis
MNYLFVHQYFHPDLSAVSQVISQVAFSVASGGDKISVLCSQNRYDAGAGNSLPVKEQIDGVEIRRCWGPNFGKRSLLGRVLDMSSFCLITSGKLLFAPRVDTVLFLTNPPFFSILGTWLQRIRKERFVYVLMDIYPDIAIQGGVLREKGWPARILRRLARFPLEKADAVVVLGEDMKEMAIRQGAPADRVVIIRNWADPGKIFPVPPEKNGLRAKWGLEGKFVVEYSGNFGVSHDFEDLLSVAEELAPDDGIRFLVIGDGVRRPEIEKIVAERKLHNVRLLPYQDVSSLSESLSAGDVHYVSLRKGFKGLVVPSKAYGAMAAGRPIVYQGAETGEIARMVKKEGIGFVVPPGDRKELRDRILELCGNPELRKRLGETARRALEERYSAAIGLALYRKVLAGEI